jgi:hypothetical protein
MQKKLKLLIFAVNLENWMYNTQELERQAIKKYADVKFYGAGYDLNNSYIPDIIKELYGENDEPDYILYYITHERIPQCFMDFHKVPPHLNKFTGFNDVKIPKIFWCNDLWNSSGWKQFAIDNFDHVLSTCQRPLGPKELCIFDDTKLESKVTPWLKGIDTNSFKSEKLEKKYDVVLSGAADSFYPLRSYFHNQLIKEKEIKYFRPPFPNYKFDADKQYTGDGYVKLLNQSKIHITDSGRYNCVGPVAKYFETMATDCLLLAVKPLGEELTHLVDGYNFVSVNQNNFLEKIKYYLENEEERRIIINNANKTIQEYHSVDIRAKQLINLLGSL